MTLLPQRVSYSQVTMFQRCKFKYWLNYIKGVYPTTKGAGLARGTMLHKAVDHYYFNDRTDSAYQGALDVMETEAHEAVARGSDDAQTFKVLEEARACFARYRVYADTYDDFEVLKYKGAVECEFTGYIQLELRNGTTKELVFKIDAPIKRRGSLWGLENKFYKTLETGGLGDDLQSSTYIAAWNKLYPKYPLEGVYYNIVKVAPGKDKSDDANFFRSEVVRTESEQKIALSNLAAVVEEMQLTEAAGLWPLSVQKSCAWDCDLYSLCFAFRQGVGISQMIGNGYTTREIEEKRRQTRQGVAKFERSAFEWAEGD